MKTQLRIFLAGAVLAAAAWLPAFAAAGTQAEPAVEASHEAVSPASSPPETPAPEATAGSVTATAPDAGERQCFRIA